VNQLVAGHCPRRFEQADKQEKWKVFSSFYRGLYEFIRFNENNENLEPPMEARRSIFSLQVGLQ
jgi:hypothetical protein